MRYAYVFSEIRKPTCSAPACDIVLSVDVDPAVTGHEALKAGLRPWMLRVLSADPSYAIGLYCGEFAVLDDEGFPDQAFASSLVAWDGSAEFACA